MELRRAHLEAFLDRDWSAVRRMKDQRTRARIEALGAEEAVRLMDLLRVHVDATSLASRKEDLAAHQRVAQLLARAAEAPHSARRRLPRPGR